MENSNVRLTLISLWIATFAFGIPSSVTAQDKGPWVIEKDMFVNNACSAKHAEAGGMIYMRAPQGKLSRFSILYPTKDLEGENVSVEVELEGGRFSTLADGGFALSLEIGEELQAVLERSHFIRVRHGGDIVFDRSLDGLSKAMPALRRCVAEQT